MKYKFLRFPDFRTKAVTMSFDDANGNDVRVVEIMNKYGLKGTFNVPGITLPDHNTGAKISREEAKTLYFPNGHDVAIHGAHHTSVILSDPKDAVREVLDNRSFLEEFFGRIIRGMAYPDVSDDVPEVKAMLRALGVTYARIGDVNHSFAIPKEWLAWKMTSRVLDKSLFELVDRFVAHNAYEQYVSHRESILFSFWGHSFEFQPDKWNILEEFGEKIGGKADTWYCNNTELYEYCHAWDSLVFSCDNTMVYNPTVQTVWFEASTKNYVIAPGETITLES